MTRRAAGYSAFLAVSAARVEVRLPVGGLPVRLATGFGSVWVSDDEGGRVLRIEPQG